ncbi:MAG: pilus assembly protein PilO [Methylophilaceae bacterium 17-43-7]|jgi:type IV pilus assembly protein PilO|nr:MAG: pilus assembly protein PilO [Methylophilales bacterium 28-44-11]OYY97075.1 MAG: pilus assembly protein PilO [Methylophilales bacterium 16-45-7]OYZ69070.1 MAG: pilus assembly protein PilO [Methylophilaceae bacterium 17-43-7]
MKLEDFNNIDLKNAGSLPLPIKAVLLGVLGLILVGIGYWFMWSPAIDELDQSIEKEKELRTVFLAKKSQAIKIEAYRQQMVEIEKTFGALLKQLPDKSEMDGLLTDVNQAGLGRGLEFELFKPGQETVAEFYAEMPIQIKVLGGYHDLGAFATDVSKLPRIVTLNNLVIQPVNKETKDGRLVLEAVAKTYRYLDSSEIAAKKSADKKVTVQ